MYLHLTLNCSFLLFSAIPAIQAQIWRLGIERPSLSINAARTIAAVRLGDGVVRVRANERRQHTNVDTGREPPPINLRWMEWPDGSLSGGLSQGATRPSQPPTLRPSQPLDPEQEQRTHERSCYFLGCDLVSADQNNRQQQFVENRRFRFGDGGAVAWEDSVVVIREGLALPVQSLLELVNTVYAVVVLRRDTYYCLHNNFALSAEEEESILEWGVGRLVFSNIYLAVGGLLLVAMAEHVWRPAVVGVLLVAAAAYRVRGTHTKLIRVRSDDWTSSKLVPRGIHGLERAVQVVLLTTLALADLLESRVWLLVGLSATAAKVVMLEVLGQAILTWSFKHYFKEVSHHLTDWTFLLVLGWGLSCGLYLVGAYVTIFVMWVLFAVVLAMCLSPCLVLFLTDNEDDEDEDGGKLCAVWSVPIILSFFLAFLCVEAVASELGVNTSYWSVEDGENDWLLPKDLSICTQPWKWPLMSRPYTVGNAFGLPFWWFVAVSDCVLVAFVVVSSMVLRMGSDRTETVELRRSKRGSRRERFAQILICTDSSVPSHDVA